MPNDSPRSQERTFDAPMPGVPMLLLGILLFPAAIWLFVLGAQRDDRGLSPAPFVIAGIALIPTAILVLRGLVLVNPNHSKAVLLFGVYKGTIRKEGFFWINPFTARHDVSLRARNFESDKLKVNDKSGNPIEIGAVIVWRVKDTAQALFDVDDYVEYVQVQSESALRAMAANHPYDADDAKEGETSLRGSADIVSNELLDEVDRRLERAGVDVMECRLTHLAYAPEIASAMLQRQQADAVIAARTKIVDGAVGMVEMALAQLKDGGIVDLDEERKAAMVQNLLVVLCSERGTQPIVNAGTIYQ